MVSMQIPRWIRLLKYKKKRRDFFPVFLHPVLNYTFPWMFFFFFFFPFHIRIIYRHIQVISANSQSCKNRFVFFFCLFFFFCGVRGVFFPLRFQWDRIDRMDRI